MKTSIAWPTWVSVWAFLTAVYAQNDGDDGKVMLVLATIVIIASWGKWLTERAGFEKARGSER